MKSLDGVYIADEIGNISEYSSLGPGFAKAAEFLCREDLQSLPDGRYQIDAERVYAVIERSCLRKWGTARAEVHRRYFDIQVPLSGPDKIGVARIDQSLEFDFDKDRDIGFCDGVALEPLVLHPGEFAILHPSVCAHAPCCSVDGSGMIRKVVVKVLG